MSRIIQIASIQRRNQGIYHPTYNPEGTALTAYDSSGNGTKMVKWYELPDSQINSLQDCFDPDKIAIYKLDSQGNATVTTLSNQDGTYWQTGLIESKVSGRPDGIYADEVNERDVEDLRMDAKKKVFKQGLDENLNKAIIGELRGKENLRDITFAIINKDVLYTGDGAASNNVEYSLYVGSGIDDYILKHNGKYVYGKEGDIVEIFDNNGNYVKLIYKDDTNLRRLTFTNTSGSYGMPWTAGNNVKISIIVSTSKSYTYNNTLTQTDIIGDPRSLQDRIQYTVDSNETITLDVNEYLLCNDSTNNKGTKGHLYRWLGESISIDTNSSDSSKNANVDGGRIDFSDDSYWVDLGSDLTIGGYPQEWIDKGIAGTPLIVGEKGESLLPVDIYNWHSLNIKLSKKYTSIKQILVKNKSGSFEDANNDYVAVSGDNVDYAAYWLDETNNMIKVGILSSYQHLGYASEQEMLDLMKVIVTYETKANNMEVADNSEVLELKDEAITFGNKDTYNGNLLLQNLINKIGTDNNVTYLAGNSFKLNKFRIRPEDIILNTTLSELTNEIMNLSASKTPAIKVIPYLTQENNRAYLQFVFKEMKYDSSSNTWGDDNKFQIVNKVSTTTDLNGKTVLIGQKRIPLNFFISED